MTSVRRNLFLLIGTVVVGVCWQVAESGIGHAMADSPDQPAARSQPSAVTPGNEHRLANSQSTKSSETPRDPRETNEVASRASAATGSATSAATLVYDNSLGTSAIPAFGSLAGLKISDDVITTAISSCQVLDSYSFRVTGDARGDGSGVGPYTVTYALYELCPGAGGEIIPGTSGTESFPDNGMYDVVFQVPSETTAKIPSNFHLAMSFDRSGCGAIGGAPALVGFSDDSYGSGGWCSARYGSAFPEGPHFSFNLQVYLREECPSSFPAYHATNTSRDPYAAEVDTWVADDIQLDVPGCLMSAYSVRVAGLRRIDFDLRTDPAEVGSTLTPGTTPRERYYSVSYAPTAVRFEYDPPVPIPQTFFFMAKVGVDDCSPIITGSAPAIGNSSSSYWRMDPVTGDWTEELLPDNVYAAFDVTFECAGSLPQGACCDMQLTDGAGDSVCRDVPRRNCPFPELWVEGATCESVCIGGERDGLPCTRYVDCPGGDCPGPFPASCGLSACCVAGAGCQTVTQNECAALEPDSAIQRFEPGDYCFDPGQTCPIDACSNYLGSCTWGAMGICVGGSRDGGWCGIELPCDQAPCCPEGGICEPIVGCYDPVCCTDVCALPGMAYCCETQWDEGCSMVARNSCSLYGSVGHKCRDVLPGGEIPFLPMWSQTRIDLTNATSNPDDPGYCCHLDQPGAKGFSTLWFKFIAPEAASPDSPFSSVQISTCVGASNIPGSAADTLLQVFEPVDLDLGACQDGIACSVTAQGCADGSVCMSDAAEICRSLVPLACNDNATGSCSLGEVIPGGGSSVCARNFIPGETYIAMVSAKNETDVGPLTLTLSPYCSPLPSPWIPDCDQDGLPNVCDFAPFGVIDDCNQNGVPDSCDASFAVESAKLLRTDAAAGQDFGSAVAMSGDLMVVGSPSGTNDALLGDAIVYRFDGSTWQEDGRLSPSNTKVDVLFGTSVAIDGDDILVGAPLADGVWPGTGAVFVFRKVGDSWLQVTVISPDDENAGGFGTTIALDGDTLAVSAPKIAPYGRMAVYVLVRDPVTLAWEPETKLTSPHRYPSEFGPAIAVSTSRILVGTSPTFCGSGDIGCNVAYMYVRDEDGWRRESTLSSSLLSPYAGFGQAVALSGARAAVGAAGINNGNDGPGAVYPYELKNGRWTQQDVLGATTDSTPVQFGKTVVMRGGVLLVAGSERSFWPQGTETISDFRYVDHQWALNNVFTSSWQSTDDDFGVAIAVSDGKAVVGAPLDDEACVDDESCDSGVAYVFSLSQDCDLDGIPDDCQLDSDGDRVIDACDNCQTYANPNQEDCNADGVGDICEIANCDADDLTCRDCDSNQVLDVCELGLTWVQSAAFFGSREVAHKSLGRAVAIDGDWAVAGAVYRTQDPGSAYVYHRSDGVWTERTRLQLNEKWVQGGFGWSVAIEGDTIVVGAPMADGEGESESFYGAVFVFRLVDGLWAKQSVLQATTPAKYDEFGTSVAISGDVVLIGAPRDDQSDIDAGAAYVFRRESDRWVQEAKLLQSPDAGVLRFGAAVSVSGSTAVISSESDTAHVFDFDQEQRTWEESSTFGDDDPGQVGGFGASVCVDENVVIVGDPDQGAVFVYTRKADTWIRDTILPPYPGFDQFGSSVSVRGNALVVGQTGDGARSPYFFSRVEGVWIFDHSTPSQVYGSAIGINHEGTAIVGAPRYQEQMTDQGAVYMLEPVRPNDCDGNLAYDACEEDVDLDGVTDACDNCPAIPNADQGDCDDDGRGDLCQLADCLPEDLTCRDCNDNDRIDTCESESVAILMARITDVYADISYETLGSYIAIEGETALVGSPNENDGAGAVHLFRLGSEGWHRTQVWQPPAQPRPWLMGSGVSLRDGRIAVMGTSRHSNRVAYSFEADGDVLRERSAIDLPPDTYTSSQRPVRIEIARNNIFLNAMSVILQWGWEDSRWTLENVFSFDGGGYGLIGSFGDSLVLSNNTLFVGVPGCDRYGCSPGLVQAYRFNGVRWFEDTLLAPNDSRNQDLFGKNVTIDGDIAVIGGYSLVYIGNNWYRGQAHVFRRGLTGWQQETVLTAVDPEITSRFADALATNGKIIAASSDSNIDLFKFTGVGWARWGTITPPPEAQGEAFGYRLDMDGQFLIVASPVSGSDTPGSAYIYRIASPCDQNAIPEECRLDSDSDTIFDECDNCPTTFNVGQKDTDGDGLGDACDACPLEFDLDYVDADGDQVGDSCDNCPDVSNTAQADCDADGVGDACVISDCTGLSACGDCNENAIPDVCDLQDFAVSGPMIPEDGVTENGFGATVDVSGTTLIIGAKLDAGNGASSGAAYIMKLDAAADQWVQEIKLTANDAAVDDRFGSAVAISYSTAAVGAPFSDGNGSNSGSVYVFQNSWSQQIELTANDAAAGDEFGGAVSMAHEVIVVGAVRDDDGGIDSGAAYVFRYKHGDTSWTQEAKLTASDGSDFDSFGQSVAISENVILVGAVGDDDNGQDSGAVHVFRFDGVVWNQDKKLTASDGASWDHFGNAVALYGNVAVVGAPDDDNPQSNSGSVYVFSYDGANWIEQTKLRADVALEGDSFGTSVSIVEDIIVVGASRARRPGINMGSSYVFQYHEGSWSVRSELTAPRPSEFDFFGTSVAASGDLIVIGAEGREDLGSTNGAAYTYAFLRDCNHDGVPDECQSGDAVIDLIDAARLQQCMTNPCPVAECEEVLGHGGCCRLSDFDSDGDIDLKDYAELQRAFPHP